MKLFDELEEIYNDSSYNTRIGRYNSYENSYSFENDFIENYNYYFENLSTFLNQMNLDDIKNNIKI